MKSVYVVYEKTYIERLGEVIDDEMNLCESENVYNLIKLLRSKNIKVAKAAIYKAIKSKKPIYNKYFVYKMKL